MSRIRRLDDHVAASVRGSQIIGSVGRAVEELVLNSIVGCSNSISISFGNDEIKISDDGRGINIDAMRLYIGTNYCSNSGEASEMKGETLRSLASLCLEMKIETRAAADSRKQQALSNVNGKSSLETNRGIGIVQCEKVFRSGHVVSFNQSTDNSSTSSVLPKLNRLNSGTTIIIRGLFHQHAVRRKHLTNQDGTSNSQDLAQVRACLRVLALSYPHVAFKLSFNGKVDCSYQTNISSSNISPSLRLKSRALIQRLCEVYPNDFTQDLSIELILEESSSQVFGALCIFEEEGGDDDVLLRNRDLEMICVNGRVAAQSDVLADVVMGQVKIERGSSKTNCSVHFFIHISSKSSELVIKDSVATNSVPHIDKLARSLKKMISNAMMNSQQSMQPYDMSTTTDSQSVYTQNTSFSRPMVKGQHITSSFDKTATAAPRKRSTTKTTTANYPSSPFSSAFFADTIQPPTEDNSNTNATKPAGDIDMSTNELSFEDAFLEQDVPTPNQTENTTTTSSNMDIDYNFDDEQDTSATSTMWTRQRIKGLERTIANLAPEASTRGSDGKISLTKKMLSNAQVIAQVELKFIIIKTACGVLCAVDQHAADERVALEKLESALCNPNLHDDTIINLTKRSVKKSDILKATQIAPSKRIILSQKDMSTVKHHYSLLQKWKFTFEEAEDKTLLITGLPSVCDRTAEVSDFLDFVRILGHSSGEEIKPPFVKHVLASNACRYAIMFGDELTHDKCVELISSLSKCDFCFICAHGRPSIIPLIDMNKDVKKDQSTSEGKTGSKEVKDDVKYLEGKSLKFQPRRVLRR